MNTTIKAAVRTRDGDEFAPLSGSLKRDLGMTQRQVMLQRAEAARMREAKRARALLDAADRHAELAMLADRGRRMVRVERPPWWLAVPPLMAAVVLLIVVATAGWWL